jgi:hypothetical protein
LWEASSVLMSDMRFHRQMPSTMIQGAGGWSQYLVSPVRTWLQLVAYSPEGGNAGFYEIVQTADSSVKYRTYQLYPGYNRMDFCADQAGRRILLFVVNNRPSNAVVVDALYQSPPSTEISSRFP